MKPDAKPLESTKYEGKEVRLCTDGKYRWTYPMNMLTNPHSVYITVCKIFGSMFAIAFILAYIRPLFRGEFANSQRPEMVGRGRAGVSCHQRSGLPHRGRTVWMEVHREVHHGRERHCSRTASQPA